MSDIPRIVSSLEGVPSSTDEITKAMLADFPELDAEVLSAAIGPSIDVLYAARDAGLVMHHAGAACAIAVLKVVHELRRLT